jgi:hypothetical protein
MGTLIADKFKQRQVECEERFQAVLTAQTIVTTPAIAANAVNTTTPALRATPPEEGNK